jgi:hypothetical protein
LDGPVALGVRSGASWVRLRIKHEETTDGLLRSKEEEQPKQGCHDFLRRGSLTKRDCRIPQSHHGNFRIREHTRLQPLAADYAIKEREHTCKIVWLLKYKQHRYFMSTLNILANGKLLFMKSNLSTLDF